MRENTTNTNNTSPLAESETALNLKPYLDKISGLDILEDKQTGFSDGETLTTLIIEEWIKPPWANTQLRKLDYPEMGYICYLAEAPPPKI